jgi:hypothetical protein
MLCYIAVQKLCNSFRHPVDLYFIILVTSGEVILVDELVIRVASKLYWGNSGLAPHILNLNIIGRAVVIVTLRLVYSPTESSYYNMEEVWYHKSVRTLWRKENCFASARNRNASSSVVS